MDNFKNIINSGYRQMLKDTAPKIVSRAKGVIPYNVVDDIVYALKYGNRTPKVGTNATIDALYKTIEKTLVITNSPNQFFILIFTGCSLLNTLFVFIL